MLDFREIAEKNFAKLGQNPYPGRGLIIGKNDYGTYIIAYWLMGRSPNSRNRRFASGPGCVFTEACDPSQMKDPSLVIYNAIRQVYGQVVVSNGHQTDAIADGIVEGRSFHDTLLAWEYEPDAPHFTPRISGILHTEKALTEVEMSIIYRGPQGAATRIFHSFDLIQKGIGRCITTYEGDGNPLPSFRGDPYLVPTVGDAVSLTRQYWDALNPENRVAIVVVEIDEEGHMRTPVRISRHDP